MCLIQNIGFFIFIDLFIFTKDFLGSLKASLG